MTSTTAYPCIETDNYGWLLFQTKTSSTFSSFNVFTNHAEENVKLRLVANCMWCGCGSCRYSL